MDARIRELERAAARDPEARRQLAAARARLGQFTCCGRPRPPGSCGLCWHCRRAGEVLVGEHRGGDRPGAVIHIARIVKNWSFDARANRLVIVEEDTFARCDARYRGPGPLRWGVPTCRRCLGIEALPDRCSRLAWEQLVAFTRHAPTILYDGTPILVPGLYCPECPNGGVAMDVIGWADDGEPEDFDVTCSADCDTEDGHAGGSVWLDLMDEAHRWAAAHVRVQRG